MEVHQTLGGTHHVRIWYDMESPNVCNFNEALKSDMAARSCMDIWGPPASQNLVIQPPRLKQRQESEKGGGGRFCGDLLCGESQGQRRPEEFRSASGAPRGSGSVAQWLGTPQMLRHICHFGQEHFQQAVAHSPKTSTYDFISINNLPV